MTNVRSVLASVPVACNTKATIFWTTARGGQVHHQAKYCLGSAGQTKQENMTYPSHQLTDCSSMTSLNCHDASGGCSIGGVLQTSRKRKPSSAATNSLARTIIRNKQRVDSTQEARPAFQCQPEDSELLPCKL